MNKTRQEMIDDLLKVVEDWPIENLIEEVQAIMLPLYENQSLEALTSEWKTYCSEEEE